MKSRLESVIGLEVHARLSTQTKIFCSCANRFGAAPNELTCPTCLGLPGALPRLNSKAVDFAIRLALATRCHVHTSSGFDRKNFLYPDLPKGYQITQFRSPIAEHGTLFFQEREREGRVGVRRIQLEEDAGKLVHGGSDGRGDFSLVDFNRGGAPLVEIVTEPELRTPEEAAACFSDLRVLLLYLGICDGNMERGSLRCDANLSVRTVGSSELNAKSEIKNLNSFRHLRRSLSYEIERQIQSMKNGETLKSETRHWNKKKGKTEVLRNKEAEQDYRYFPEPDLLPLRLDEERLRELARTLPELPMRRSLRFREQYGLAPGEAHSLCSDPYLADYYEQVVRRCSQPKTVANWIQNELLRSMKENASSHSDYPISANDLADLIRLVEDGSISTRSAREVYDETIRTSESPQRIVERRQLTCIDDPATIQSAIDDVLANNMVKVGEYREGRVGLLDYFVGKVLGKTGGRARPDLLNRLLRERLEK